MADLNNHPQGAAHSEAMSGGEAIVAALLNHGIDTVFGLPGVQTYGLFDALALSDGRVRVIGARHEQTCGYMAYGYARATGRPSVFCVVPGPGVLNSGAALLTALSANEPVLLVTGQVPSAFLDRHRGHLHEMPDQLGTLHTLVKWAARCLTPSTAQSLVAQAFQQMLSGRRGPAAIELPWDVFSMRTAVVSSPVLAPLPAPCIDEERMARAVKFITKARAPMIFVGGGALHAAQEVQELAEVLDAPVVAFRSGRGIVSNDHRLGLTAAEAYPLWSSTDLALGIGTRMEIPSWHWRRRAPELKVIRIDIDPAEMLRTPPDVPIVADARVAVSSLLEALGCANLTRNPDRRAQIADAVARTQDEVERVQPQVAYLRALREVLPRDGILTDEICQAGYASWYAFPVFQPRTFISSGYQGNLGYGFPTALGVKAGFPDRCVVALSGDGGFLFAGQELATAVQHRLGVVVIVFNNNSFGNVLRDQMEQFQGRVIGSRLVNPDFVRFAESFGVAAERVRSPVEFRLALERALGDGNPRLIEVALPSLEASPWHLLYPEGF